MANNNKPSSPPSGEAGRGSLYSIHDRGQVVTYACQWIAEHWKLAIRLILAPVWLLLAMLIVVNFTLMESEVWQVVIGVIAVAILPIMPNVMMHVVENKEEYGYPERMPGLLDVLKLWRIYFRDIFVIVVLGSLANTMLSFTIVVPLFSWAVIPLAIVVRQRDKTKNIFEVFVAAGKIIINNFGAFLMCQIGMMIIGMSLAGAPFVVINVMNDLLRQFFNIRINGILGNLPFKTDVTSLATYVAFIGGIYALQIGFIIEHFFYGHATEKAEHPALIEKLEHFENV